MHIPEPSRAGAAGSHKPFPSQQMGRAQGSSATRRHHGSELAWGGVSAPLASTPWLWEHTEGPPASEHPQDMAERSGNAEAELGGPILQPPHCPSPFLLGSYTPTGQLRFKRHFNFLG